MNSAGLTKSASPRTPALSVVHLCAASIVLVAGLAGNGCQHFEFGSREQILTDWDNPAVGQMAMRMYLRAHQPSQRTGQKQLLEQVGSRLAAVADRPGYDWHFKLVDDPQPGVVVFPGANVVVTEGMIAACSNEAEFAAALTIAGTMQSGVSSPARIRRKPRLL